MCCLPSRFSFDLGTSVLAVFRLAVYFCRKVPFDIGDVHVRLANMFGWLRREPMYLIEHRHRIFEALTGYPVYEPPFRQGPNYARQSQHDNDENDLRAFREFTARGERNLEYFLEHRDARLAALETFLAKFNVKTGIDDHGLAMVSAWCRGNCGALVANLRHHKTRQVFYRLLEPWTGQWRGLNVIFDLGVCFGECVIFRNKYLRWSYHPGGASHDDRAAYHSGYAITGFKRMRDSLDPMAEMYIHCYNDEIYLRSGRNHEYARNADALLRAVRDRSTR